MSSEPRIFGDPTFRLGGDIEAVAVSPDGASIAVGSGAIPSEIRVVDARTGALRFSFSEPASALAFADDTTLWSAYAQLHRWNLGESRPTFTSGAHGAPLAVAARVGLLAVARRPGEAGDVDVLSLADGGLVLALPGPGERASSLAFSTDGKRLAVGYGGSAAVFDVANGRRTALAVPSGGTQCTVAFTDRGELVVGRTVAREIIVVDGDGHARTWALDDTADESTVSPSSGRYAFASGGTGIWLYDTRTGKKLFHGQHRGSQWGPMAFVSESRLAVATSHRLRFLDPSTGAFEDGGSGHDDGISAIALSHDGATLATAGGFDCTIHLWRARDGTHLHTLRNHENRVLSLAFSPDDTTLASSGSDGSLRLTNVVKGRERHAVPLAHGGSEVTLAYSSRGDLVTMGGDGDVTLRDEDGGVRSVVARFPGTTDYEIGRIAFDGTGQWLACVGPRDEVRIFEAFGANAGRVTFSGPATPLALAFAPDEPLLAYRRDQEVVLAEVPSGREILRREVLGVREIALLPQRRLALACSNGRLTLFDAISGRAGTVPLPSAAAVVVVGPWDELFVGLENTTAVVVEPPQPTSVAIASLQAAVGRLAVRHELVGYRDAAMPERAAGDPATTVVRRGHVAIHVCVDTEGEDGWVLRLALPAAAEPPRASPEPSIIERIVTEFRGVFADETRAPPPGPAAPSTFEARGKLAELPSAEQIEAWISAFAATAPHHW